MMRGVILTEFAQKQPLETVCVQLETACSRNCGTVGGKLCRSLRHEGVAAPKRLQTLGGSISLCEAVFPLSSPDEEDHFHHGGAGGDRALLAGGPGRFSGFLRRAGSARSTERTDRLGRYRRAN